MRTSKKRNMKQSNIQDFGCILRILASITDIRPDLALSLGQYTLFLQFLTRTNLKRVSSIVLKLPTCKMFTALSKARVPNFDQIMTDEKMVMLMVSVITSESCGHSDSCGSSKNSGDSGAQTRIHACHMLSDFLPHRKKLNQYTVQCEQLKSTIAEMLKADVEKDWRTLEAVFKLIAVLTSQNENVRRELLVMDSSGEIPETPKLQPVSQQIVNFFTPYMENETGLEIHSGIKYQVLQCLISLTRSNGQLHMMLKQIRVSELVEKWIKLNFKEVFDGFGKNCVVNSNLIPGLVPEKYPHLLQYITLASNLLLNFNPHKQDFMASGVLKWLKLLTYSPCDSIRYNAVWALMNASYNTDAATRLSIITTIEWSRIIELTNDKAKCVILQTLCFIRNLICSNTSDISGKTKKEIFIGMSDDGSETDGRVDYDAIVTEYYSMIIEVVEGVLLNVGAEETPSNSPGNSPNKLTPKTSPVKFESDLGKPLKESNKSLLRSSSEVSPSKTRTLSTVQSISSSSINTGSITKSHHLQALKSQSITIFTKIATYPAAAERILEKHSSVMTLLFESCSDVNRVCCKNSILALCSIFEHTKDKCTQQFLIRYLEDLGANSFGGVGQTDNSGKDESVIIGQVTQLNPNNANKPGLDPKKKYPNFVPGVDMPDEKSLFTPNWVIPSNLSESNTSLPVTVKKVNSPPIPNRSMSAKLFGRNRQNETQIIKRIQAVLNSHL